ncbi:mechanosensitive ion channel family protein [Candidatus Borrarchaeum sp.]|uniref:mechanosensitive ion channel family protein n=1 Tax=Candidatus Borrarchaeum sp. TaxID=2846742 RepID=UPI00257A9841|nr:mechanosensitive ion channel domain-containing protein [Candidatus Borrarchaeum sp.]
MQTAFENLLDPIAAISSVIIQNLPNLILAFIILIATAIILPIVKRSIRRAGDRSHLPRDVISTINKLVQWTILLVVFIIILNIFGLQQFWLATVIPIIFGTVIGFASIATIGNMIAGIIIMFTRPFKIGDLIQMGEDIAEVKEITIIYTKVEKGEGLLYIPNADFLRNKFINYDQKPAIIRTITFTAGYEIDTTMIESIVLKAVKDVEGVLENPSPVIRTDLFQDFAQQYKLIYNIEDFRQRGRIEGDIRRNIVKAFKENGIDLPTSHLVSLTQ